MWVQLSSGSYYRLDNAITLAVVASGGSYYVQAVGSEGSGEVNFNLAPAYSSEGDAQAALESLVQSLGVVTLPAAS